MRSEQEFWESMRDAKETMHASSMASSGPMEDTTPYPPRNINETLKGDTVNSARPGLFAENVTAVVDPDGVKRLHVRDGSPLSDLFNALFLHLSPDAVTEPVTDECVASPVDTDTMDNEDALLSETIAGLLDEVWAEVLRAIEKHPTPHASPHESYAIIKEELDELWLEIMADRGRQASARKEAIQIAAMAVRFLLDVDPH